MSSPPTANPPAAPLAPVPLYVVPRVSLRHPTPPSSSTLLFNAVFPSTQPLVWGLLVQLYLVNPGAHTPSTFSLPPGENYPAVPLAFKGRIAGERTRLCGWVEIVVRNENPLERASRAFIFVRADYAAMPIPDIAEMVADRLLRSHDIRLSDYGYADCDDREGSPTPRALPPVLRDVPRRWPEANRSEHVAGIDDSSPPGSPTPRAARAWPSPLFPRDPVWAYSDQPRAAAVSLLSLSAPRTTDGTPAADAPSLAPPAHLPRRAVPEILYSTATAAGVARRDGEGLASRAPVPPSAATDHSPAPKRRMPPRMTTSTRATRAAGSGRRHSGYRRLED
ncbi:hypothetical protein C2E23DRAFT_798607 [Lenzites betulinus]|nr:hypothetical protein C2E23DRAFT_798607 [Lenzites betulinus]